MSIVMPQEKSVHGIQKIGHRAETLRRREQREKQRDYDSRQDAEARRTARTPKTAGYGYSSAWRLRRIQNFKFQIPDYTCAGAPVPSGRGFIDEKHELFIPQDD
jgi:hypothetical protein